MSLTIIDKYINYELLNLDLKLLESIKHQMVKLNPTLEWQFIRCISYIEAETVLLNSLAISIICVIGINN